MDETIILAKLASLDRCIVGIQNYESTKQASQESDQAPLEIVFGSWDRATQICVEIASHIIADLKLSSPDTMAGSFTALHSAGVISESSASCLQENVGTNVYATIDPDDLHQELDLPAITDQLKGFQGYSTEVIRWMRRRREG